MHIPDTVAEEIVVGSHHVALPDLIAAGHRRLEQAAARSIRPVEIREQGERSVIRHLTFE
jgi:hypothetical protein